MKLLEDYDDKGFIYERWSILLKGYLFQETHQTESDVHFKDYQPAYDANIVIWYAQLA